MVCTSFDPQVAVNKVAEIAKVVDIQADVPWMHLAPCSDHQTMRTCTFFHGTKYGTAQS